MLEKEGLKGSSELEITFWVLTWFKEKKRVGMEEMSQVGNPRGSVWLSIVSILQGKSEEVLVMAWGT